MPHTIVSLIAGRLLTLSTSKVDDRELRVGEQRAGDRAVLPHAPVAGHAALGAAGGGDRAPQRGLAAPRPGQHHRLPAGLPLTAPRVCRSGYIRSNFTILSLFYRLNITCCRIYYYFVITYSKLFAGPNDTRLKATTKSTVMFIQHYLFSTLYKYIVYGTESWHNGVQQFQCAIFLNSLTEGCFGYFVE